MKQIPPKIIRSHENDFTSVWERLDVRSGHFLHISNSVIIFYVDLLECHFVLSPISRSILVHFFVAARPTNIFLNFPAVAHSYAPL